jgi:hypothetical protein
MVSMKMGYKNVMYPGRIDAVLPEPDLGPFSTIE